MMDSLSEPIGDDRAQLAGGDAAGFLITLTILGAVVLTGVAVMDDAGQYHRAEDGQRDQEARRVAAGELRSVVADRFG